MVGSTSISMYVPYGIGQVLDSISSSGSAESVVPLLTTMSVIFITGAGINFGRVAIFKWINEKIVNDTRKTLFRSYLSKEMSFFDKCSTGDIITVCPSSCNPNHHHCRGLLQTPPLQEGPLHQTYVMASGI